MEWGGEVSILEQKSQISLESDNFPSQESDNWNRKQFVVAWFFCGKLLVDLGEF